MNTNSKALSCPVCGRSSSLCAFGRGFWNQGQNVLQRLFSMLPVGGPEQPRRPAQPGRQGGDDGRPGGKGPIPTPKTEDFDGPDPISYVISQNLHRRHLTQSQRAVCALEAEKWMAEQAKGRQRLSKGRGQKGPELMPDLKVDQGDARDQAGALMGVSGRYVSEAKAIQEKAPEKLEEVKAGTQRAIREEALR